MTPAEFTTEMNKFLDEIQGKLTPEQEKVYYEVLAVLSLIGLTPQTPGLLEALDTATQAVRKHVELVKLTPTASSPQPDAADLERLADDGGPLQPQDEEDDLDDDDLELGDAGGDKVGLDLGDDGGEDE